MKCGPAPRPVIERLNESVDRGGGPDACWPWLRATHHKAGYGMMKIAGKMWQAHRVAWMLNAREVAPDNMMVLHSCDNPPCCNPAHLRLGTNTENMTDRGNRNRQVQGERCHTAVLRVDDVVEIRKCLANGRTHTAIARQYKVSPSTIDALASGRSWKGVA